MAEPREILGPNDSRSVYNDTGGTLAKGTIIKLEATPERSAVITTAVTDAIYGVTAEDIADGTWGRAQIRGKALVLVSAALTVAGRVTTGTAGNSGLAADAVAGNAVLGIAITAGAVGVPPTGEYAEVELSGPGGLEMPG